jgi:peptidoglycan/xylan/chitin deacetylase (PgdA/CDA1 family)
MRIKAGNQLSQDAQVLDLGSSFSLTEADGHVSASIGGSMPAVAATDEKTVTTIVLPGAPYGVKQIVTVIVYHTIALANFQTDLDKFQEWNYTTIDPDDLYNYLTGNRDSLPDKPLLITFDDGDSSQYTVNYPELVTRGMKATFYVVPDWIDGNMTQADGGFADASPFTWANAQTMFANGMRIQSHTLHHTDLSTVTAAAAVTSWQASKARIESQVPGETVSHLAYPNGLCPIATMTALAGAGVKTGRLVRNDYLIANGGQYEFVNPFTPLMAVPCGGAGSGDVYGANVYRRLSKAPQLVPDYGFASGGAKGWSLAAGATVDGSALRPGAPAGTKSLKQVQQTSTVSSVTNKVIPIGMGAHLEGSVWVKTLNLGGAGRAFLYIKEFRADALTVWSTVNFVTAVPDNQDWTEYTFGDYLDEGTSYVEVGLQVTGAASPAGTAWFAELSLKHANSPVNLFPAVF